MKSSIIAIVLFAVFLLPTTAWATNKLFVGGLSWNTTSEEVNRLVAGFGPVLSIKVTSTDENGDRSARAEVDFETEESVDAAVAALDGLIYDGEPLRAKKKVREIVVVGSKVKAVVRSAGLRSDGELVQAVSDEVHKLLRAAIKRTKSNNRSTVRPYDL